MEQYPTTCETIVSDTASFLRQVEEFAGTDIKRAAEDWSMGQSPSESLYQKASQLGLTGIEVPCEYGGSGFSFSTKAKACAHLAQADFGFAMSVVNTHNVAKRLCISATPVVRDKYLPDLLSGNTSACTALTEPDTGSDFAAIRTRAKSTDTGWLLTGEKSWIVNARNAGLAIVFAQCNSQGDSDGIAAFLVDLTLCGVQQYPIDSAFSQTSIATGGFTLNNVEVAHDHLLLTPGTAFKSILKEINGARVYVAVMCNAMLDAAVQEACDYGASRRTFGKPLKDHESWHKIVTEAKLSLDESGSLSAEAIRLVDSDDNSQLAAINAKIAAVVTCQRHLPRLLHAMGAEGLRKHYCFTRHLAAVQMAELTDGATGLLRERANKLKEKL